MIVVPSTYWRALIWSDLGYPRIIPAFHRRLMYRKDDRADELVRMYLSFFSLSKIIVLAKKVNADTFKSIISPVEDMETVTEVVGQIKGCLSDLMVRYVPGIKRIPLNQGMSFDATWKALPTHRLTQEVLMKRVKLPKSRVETLHSCFTFFAQSRYIQGGSSLIMRCWVTTAPSHTELWSSLSHFYLLCFRNLLLSKTRSTFEASESYPSKCWDQ